MKNLEKKTEVNETSILINGIVSRKCALKQSAVRIRFSRTYTFFVYYFYPCSRAGIVGVGIVYVCPGIVYCRIGVRCIGVACTRSTFFNTKILPYQGELVPGTKSTKVKRGVKGVNNKTCAYYVG